MTQAMLVKPPAAAGIDRRAMLVGSAFAATAVSAHLLVPRQTAIRETDTRLEQVIPARIGNWRHVNRSGVVVPTEEGLVDPHDQELARVYMATGLPTIMLLIAYGSTQGGSLQLHRPETCYPGQGFVVSESRLLDIPAGQDGRIEARTLTARRDERIERLIYWTRIGDSFPVSSAGEYRAIIGSVLNGTVPDGVLVRISTIGADIALSDTVLAQFADTLLASLNPAGHRLLLGQALTRP